MVVRGGDCDIQRSTVPKIRGETQPAGQRTGRTKAYYAKKAIQELLEEQEDYFIALSRLEEKLPGIPLQELVKKIGLES
jgi:RHH-type rel operon transcriptional repressor/antitoxin RelB